MKKRISILLVEDHLIVREGIRKVLEGEEDFVVIGEVNNGREAIKSVAELRPDVVVMDIVLPELNGIMACQHLNKFFPASRVVMLSAHGDDCYVERAIEAGAAGFVLKQAPGSALSHAVREVQGGKRYFSAAILRSHREGQNEISAGTTPKKRAPLTSRESEVLQLIAEGKSNKETAFELSISIKTVEKHRTNLMRKLNIHETASLTRYAIGEGIIERRGQKTTDFKLQP